MTRAEYILTQYAELEEGKKLSQEEKDYRRGVRGSGQAYGPGSKYSDYKGTWSGHERSTTGRVSGKKGKGREYSGQSKGKEWDDKDYRPYSEKEKEMMAKQGASRKRKNIQAVKAARKARRAQRDN